MEIQKNTKTNNPLIKFQTEKLVNPLSFIACVLCGLLFLMNAVVSMLGTIDMNRNNDYKENPQFFSDNIFFNLFMLMVVFLMFLLIRPYVGKIKKKHLNTALVLWVIILGTVWVVSAQTSTQDDSMVVIDAAKMFSNNDYSWLEECYFTHFPFQLGYVFFSEILIRMFRLDGKYTLLQFFNVVWVAISYLAILDIFRHITKDEGTENSITQTEKKATVYTAILLMTALQPLLFSSFLYGNIPSFMFAIVATSFAIRYIVNGKKRYLLLTVPFLLISVMVKLNSMIIIAAICIMLFLHFLKTKKLFNIAVIAVILVFGSSLNTCIIKYYEKRSNLTVGKGIPMISWMHLGLTDGGPIAPGWFEGGFCTCGNMDEAEQDTDRAKELSKKKIKERLDELAKRPSYALAFFYTKYETQWNEPSYQSIWVNKEKRHYQEPGKIAAYVYDKGEYTTKAFMRYHQQFVFFFAYIALVLMTFRKKNYLLLIYPLIVFGGFAYHFLFEGKSQYILIYFILTIPVAALGLDHILEETPGYYDNFKKFLKSKKQLESTGTSEPSCNETTV